ncbi:hypothetical protein CEXT_113091 [Caerostris extrusa]|uniref:Uncharacterized protein n=1 Tax=Caerostris extrusa TaxID=172846 RepID=A0AAV4MBK5_CAEEX|nr:hypothetical protein CEXT_113091 [Caerostris extrusa]
MPFSTYDSDMKRKKFPLILRANQGFILYTTSQLSFMNGVCHLHNIRFRWDKRPFRVTREKKLCDKVLSSFTSQMISLASSTDIVSLRKVTRLIWEGQKSDSSNECHVVVLCYEKY